MKERNVQPNAIFEGDKLSAPLSVSLDDAQSAKQTNVILMTRSNGQPNARFEGESWTHHLAFQSLDGPKPLHKRTRS